MKKMIVLAALAAFAGFFAEGATSVTHREATNIAESVVAPATNALGAAIGNTYTKEESDGKYLTTNLVGKTFASGSNTVLKLASGTRIEGTDDMYLRLGGGELIVPDNLAVSVRGNRSLGTWGITNAYTREESDAALGGLGAGLRRDLAPSNIVPRVEALEAVEPKVDAISEKCDEILDCVTGDVEPKVDAISEKCDEILDCVTGDVEPKVDAISEKCDGILDCVAEDVEPKVDTISGKCDDILDCVAGNVGETLDELNGEVVAGGLAAKAESAKTSAGLVAAAIAAKGGDVPERFADYGAAVEALPSGGGEVEKKDVRFRDHDGTLLHSMTLSEARALTALPELPTHEGLVCKGWNFTLDELKSAREVTEVAAVYETDDGATRFHIEIQEGEDLGQVLVFEFDGTSVTVDWGDGTPSETEAGYRSVMFDKLAYLEHTYAPSAYPAKYVISVKVNGGTAMSLGGMKGMGSANYHLFGVYSEVGETLRKRLRRVESGDCLTGVYDQALKGCANLGAFVTSDKLAAIGEEAFSGCGAMAFFVFGRGIPQIGNNALAGAGGLRNVSLAGNVTKVDYNVFSGTGLDGELCFRDGTDVHCSCINFKGLPLRALKLPLHVTSGIGDNAFSGCSHLETLILPKFGPTYVGKYLVSSCDMLRKLELPEGVTEIREFTFSSSRLEYLKLPSTLESIGHCGFDFLTDGGAVLDFTAARQVPALESTSMSSWCVRKIVVPDSLYGDWIAAENWSSFTNKIVKASDFR